MHTGLQRCAALLALVTGACAHAPLPEPVERPDTAGSACRSTAASLHFNFEGAAPLTCSITGERSFTLLVTPEHAPPINPSPWYAFGYEADDGDPVMVTLRYLGGTHRYTPKWSNGSTTRELPVTLNEDGTAATLGLPPGKATVSAQEIVAPADHHADLLRWSKIAKTAPFSLGLSHDGRPVEGLRLGRPDAPQLVVLLGRQHPPEVTGAIAMTAFVDQLVDMLARDPMLGARTQFLVIPLLNPDGTARGHWRANRGATDLNRDWGDFSQPETRAVKAWLDALPTGVRPVLMLDFHSTYRNLFYVQGDEASGAQKRFLSAWLEGREDALAGYPFTIEPRNANPGSGTAKNWFHATYGIPAYTYEVADAADRVAARKAAGSLASGLITAIGQLGESPPD